VRRMAMSVVALHVVAKIVDYYITKYAAKPMEQLQNLVSQYAMGLKRLEDEEEQQQSEPASLSDVSPLAKRLADKKVRARRVLLRLQHAANRSKWISSTECALYVHTEQQHWTSHNEVPMFLTRAVYQQSECKRILSGDKTIITRAATAVDTTVVSYECVKAPGDGTHFARPHPRAARACAPDDINSSSGQPGDAPQLASVRGGPHKPASLSNIGNTCFMNALVQCCRQVVLRIPLELRPRSKQCPLASMLEPQAGVPGGVEHWPCWKWLPTGSQRDASHVLEMCLDSTAPLHGACEHAECYGRLLQELTSFELVRETLCANCPYTHEESQRHCILRVEPEGTIQASIDKALRSRCAGVPCQHIFPFPFATT